VPGARGGLDPRSCVRQKSPEPAGESEVVIAQGGLSKYYLHVSDVRSRYGGDQQRDPRKVSREPVLTGRAGSCRFSGYTSAKDRCYLPASALSGVGGGEAWLGLSRVVEAACDPVSGRINITVGVGSGISGGGSGSRTVFTAMHSCKVLSRGMLCPAADWPGV
jgi:hypothetical protein